MKRIDDLRRLRADFDIFTESSPLPAEVVRSGCVPPIPCMGEFLVWGFPLLDAAQNLEMQELPCTEFAGVYGDALELALMLENRRDRYSWHEKGNILNLLKGHEDSLHKIELLVQGEGSFVPGAQKFMALPRALQQLTAAGLVDLKTAEQLCRLPESVFSEYKEIIEKLSYSSRRQLLVMFGEIIKRDSVRAVEAETLAKRIFSASDPFKAVREMRYPRLTELESEVEEFKKRYTRGSGIELLPPPNFEGAAFQIKFSWRSEKQFTRTLEILREMGHEGDRLFKLLF